MILALQLVNLLIELSLNLGGLKLDLLQGFEPLLDGGREGLDVSTVGPNHGAQFALQSSHHVGILQERHSSRLLGISASLLLAKTSWLGL